MSPRHPHLPSRSEPLSRRTVLALGAAAAFGALLPKPARAALVPQRIVLHNIHTGESLAAEPGADGAFGPMALADVNHVLRDHRNGAVHPIDPMLLALLGTVAERCGRDAEFEVISGYRSPESNAAMHAKSSGVAAHSLHMEGRAMDVRLVGCDLARVRDAGLALGQGGVGFYRGPQFVHLDTGRVRSWNG